MVIFNSSKRKRTLQLIDFLTANKINSKKDSDVLKLLFNKLFPLFLYKIKLYGITLSNQDEMVIILEKIGYNVNQISKSLEISVEEVNQIRQNFYNKFNYLKPDALLTYIENPFEAFL
ncbi:hypothetical protein [Tamlana sp. I1]|uniref:hypothetical protein n=1 Tax=Tamlana sp. I1 TaxID=2762061 RepID=UPI00189030FA|nr:hypothetical protein [Tamlana sp. I1]